MNAVETLLGPDRAGLLGVQASDDDRLLAGAHDILELESGMFARHEDDLIARLQFRSDRLGIICGIEQILGGKGRRVQNSGKNDTECGEREFHAIFPCMVSGRAIRRNIEGSEWEKTTVEGRFAGNNTVAPAVR